MPPKKLRFTLIVIAAGIVLSACQADVRVSTKLNESGGGTFSLAVDLDREARIGLGAIKPKGSDMTGMQMLVGLFDGLRAKHWDVAIRDSDGALSFTATRAFKDSAGFDELLADLRGSDDPAPTPIGAPQLKLDFTTERSFFRTRSTFSGVFDTAPEADSLRRALDIARNNIRFELRAELPGAVRVGDQSGTVVGNDVVWRPELGSQLSFVARSSALRVGPVLIALVPGLLLLCALAWLLLGRRKPSETLAIVLDSEPVPAMADLANGNGTNGHSTNGDAPSELKEIVLDPEPIDELLAIERDPVDS